MCFRHATQLQHILIIVNCKGQIWFTYRPRQRSHSQTTASAENTNKSGSVGER